MKKFRLFGKKKKVKKVIKPTKEIITEIHKEAIKQDFSEVVKTPEIIILHEILCNRCTSEMRKIKEGEFHCDSCGANLST